PLGTVPIGLFDPVLEALDEPRQPDVLPLPDGHCLLAVLVRRILVVFLALGPCLPQIPLRLAVVALALYGERLATQQRAVAVASQEPVDEFCRKLPLLGFVDMVGGKSRQLRHFDTYERGRDGSRR